jgi:hypothetical protein
LFYLIYLQIWRFENYTAYRMPKALPKWLSWMLDQVVSGGW